ncbi:MAG: 23S rRNA (guanosine(2251)-2'-O)-methyltransferase RlmB [Thermoplasmatota archaeon]
MPHADVLAGKNPVLEALRAGREITRLYVTESAARDKSAAEILRLAEQAGVEIERASAASLDRISRGAVHNGVVAVAAPRAAASLDDAFALARSRGEDPFFIALDGVEDPHNLGAVLRVADGAGAHAVIIPDRGAAGLTPGAVKASAGASEHVLVVEVANVMAAIERAKREEVWVCGAVAGKGKPHWDERLTGPLLLIMGSESEGLSRPVEKHCDFFVSIPLAGKMESLNVSVATAVLAFERRRQQAHRS